MRDKLIVLLVVIGVVGIGALVYASKLDAGHSHQLNVPTRDLTETQAAELDELSRLNSLVVQQVASEGDFATMEQLADDDVVKDEVGEIKTLVKYQEYEHAAHSIGFLESYIKSGIEVSCPGHSLSHYYVFEKHGETELADENFEAAKEDLPEWIPAAREYVKQVPTGADIDEAIQHITDDIAKIDSGDTTVSDAELEYLLTDGSICVG
jgi:hypothetical protein